MNNIFPFKKSNLNRILKESNSTAEQLLNWFKTTLKICRNEKSRSTEQYWRYPCINHAYLKKWSFDNETSLSYTYVDRGSLFLSTKNRLNIFAIWHKALTDDLYAQFLIQEFSEMYNIEKTNIHYDTSIIKWQTFKTALEKFNFKGQKKYELKEYWSSFLWIKCGFCDEFYDHTKHCLACPLFPKYCAQTLKICIWQDNFMAKIYEMFLRFNFEETAKLVGQLLDEMQKHQMKFKQ